MKIVFALVVVLSLALVAQAFTAQQLPNYPIVIGYAPVIVVPSIGLDAECPTCYRDHAYYSGGPSARWEIKVSPWFRIDPPDWVTCATSAQEPLRVWCETAINDSGSFREGSLRIGDQTFTIRQEAR